MKWLLAAVLSVGVLTTPQWTTYLAPTPQPVEVTPISILAFGDMMLDRSVRLKIEESGIEYLFEKIKPILANRDIIVANAEGPFTQNAPVIFSRPDELSFTFPPKSVFYLRALNFTVLSQANNHALNFGWSGLKESKQRMSAVGILAFGDPENINPGPVYKEVKGHKVAFVGYHQFSGNGGNSSTTVAAITKAKQDGAFVMVFPHWGDEYNLAFTNLQQTLAHKFIDAGADVVLGAHPHVVEPLEMYNGKAIFYSMGNFIFDQPWEDTKKGLAVEIQLGKDKVTYNLLPYTIDALQPQLMEGEARTTFLQKFSEATLTGSFVLDR